MATIKNEYSTIPAERSVSEIQKSLIQIGARRFTLEYDEEERLCAVSFRAKISGGQLADFLLPARVDACYKVLIDQYKRPTDKSRETAGAIRMNYGKIPNTLNC